MPFCRRLVAAGLLACVCSIAQESGNVDAKTKVRTAKSLSKSGSESIPQLLPLLKDPAVDVRREAVRSLITIGTQYSLEPLIAATRDNDADVQIRATEGIVNFYLPGYVESGSLQRVTSAVRSRFDRENRDVIDPYVTVRPDAIRALASLVRGGASIEGRASAARALGILRGQAGLPELITALRSKEDAVIFESLIALQKIRDESAGARVIFLLRDLEERIQVAAIETAGLLRTHDAVLDLRTVYGEAKSDRVKRAALGALAMIADPSVKVLFQNGITDKSEGVRASAAEGFARLKDKSTRPALETLFTNEKKM
ncbi:MAG: HEAT repeat domain-containing protein, partial [Bryobacteraceae bacterium]|nr:HEAT repeat domain-containing protein [Bryobacteraceae bacterium]